MRFVRDYLVQKCRKPDGETGCLPGAFVRKTPVTSDFDSFAQENYKNSFKMNIDLFSFF